MKLKVNAAASEIYIYDDIGPDWAGMISGETVVAALATLGKSANVTVRLNSPGGDVFEGFTIYNALRRHAGKVTVEIDGLAASAASLVAMAGDTINMAGNALMMVHNAWMVVAGNKSALQEAVGVLDKIDENLIKTYADRSGLSRSEVKAMLNAETWLTSTEAKSHGLIDKITGSSSAKASVERGRYRNTPERILQKNEALRQRFLPHRSLDEIEQLNRETELLLQGKGRLANAKRLQREAAGRQSN